MLRSLKITLLLLLFTNVTCFAQLSKKIDSLCIACKSNLSDEQKVMALGKLAEYYSYFKLDKKADSVLQDQLRIADFSNNNDLVIATLFSSAISNINTWDNTDSYNRAIKFIQKGIDYAKSKNNYDYIALGYCRMASVLRKSGDFDNALNNVNIALSYSENLQSDSIRAVMFIELGDIYFGKGQLVNACRNYTNAFDIALTAKNISLQSDLYHKFSGVYRSLNDTPSVIRQLKLSLELDRKNNYSYGLMRDYYDLARITDEKFYIDKALALADSLHLDNNILLAKILMFSYIMVRDRDINKLLQYINSEPDISQRYLNTGLGQYYLMMGNIYLYPARADSSMYYYRRAGKSGIPQNSQNKEYLRLVDSAIYYFHLAEPEIEKNFRQNLQISCLLFSTSML